MPKLQSHAYSRYSLEAVTLIGQLIRAGRIDQKITSVDMSVRMGVSRGLLRRIENGDPGCSVGDVFEAAAIAGVALFEPDRERLGAHRLAAAERLRLLPKTSRRSRKVVKDDF
jgi:transcriptional regulator with XRE-family HTH domain